MSIEAPLDKRGQFIKARKREVFQALAADLNLSAYGDAADRFYQLLTATMHYEYLGELEQLHDAYHYLAPSHPVGGSEAPVSQDAAFETLSVSLERVLAGANFVEITPEQMYRATQEAGRVKTPVQTAVGDFRKIRLFRRGGHTEEIERRSWWGLRKKQVTIEIFDEVVLFAALKPETEMPKKKKKKRRDRTVPPGSVMIKLFHNIAVADLDILFPGVRVVMTNRDKLMLGLPALIAGIPLLIKLAPAFFVLYGLLRFYLGEAQPGEDSIGEALIVASGILALFGFLTNQWIKYERRALRYQKEVADTIYFHNVTNNVGIFDHIIGTAEEQDCKEALLAYLFLLTADAPVTEGELDHKIEVWLERRFSLKVDFEVDDALRKLERFGLLTRNGEHLSVLPLPAALRELDRRWDSAFQYADVAEVA